MMATVLLCFIYVVYIGLGVPDSTIGSAWPSIYESLSLPVSYANFVTMTISLCTIITSLFSSRLINKLGTGVVTACSTLLTAIALLLFSSSGSIVAFVLLAIPLGMGAGAIDAALNNYVVLRYKSIHVSFLHCFYGIGVALSPFVFSLALRGSNDWRLGYRVIAIIQFSLATLSFISLPLWFKIKKTEKLEHTEIIPKTLSLKEMAKMPAARIGWLLFFATCGLEFTCDTWASTYLVKHCSASADVAARILTFYYVGMTGGRFISGLISTKLSNKTIIFLGYGVISLGILTLFLPVPYYVKGIGLFLIGLGNGPTFPNLAYLTPRFFGREKSQSLIGTQMAVSNLGILVLPPVFGVIAQNVGVRAFPVYVAVLFAITVISTLIYFKRTKKNTAIEKK